MKVTKNRNAFTLVELLVVIAIIGILIALLLPAVQAAREAARRSDCSNKMKQLGLALQNHHDRYKRFPPGGAADQVPFGTNAGAWGSSWLVYILPDIEQSNIYDKMIFSGGSGWGTNANNNKNAAGGNEIDAFYCPSSPLERLARSPHGGGQLSASNYVGVSGAVSGFGGLNESRNANPGGSAGCCSGGIISWGGVLYPNSETKFANITDGTSNTAFVGEQGNFLVTQNGTKQDWRSSGLHGFIIGWNRTGNPATSWTGDLRHFNTSTLRYRINQMKGWTDAPGNCGSQGICDNASSNLPFNSTHPGGSQFAFCDGSVHFIPATVDDAVLARMCTRDDGQTFDLP